MAGSVKRERIIYLAGPYSNDAPANPQGKASAEKRLARFDAVTEVARHLIEQSEIVYSPFPLTMILLRCFFLLLLFRPDRIENGFFHFKG